MDKIFKFLKDYFLKTFGLIEDINGNIRIDSTPQGILNFVCCLITFIFSAACFYRVIYTIIGFFCKSPKYPEAPKTKRYCFVLCARNEQNVIGNTIDSILRQDYPSELIDIIVVADNCDKDDKTAEIAKQRGAKVYIRDDLSKKRKGWGLQYLFEHLKTDLPNGITTYDAYMFLDADNVIDEKFVSAMNNAYSTGKFDLIYGYLNTKNFADNWVTCAYGFNFYRATMVSHRPRAVLGCGTKSGGTGFLCDSNILKDGWPWTEIVEDTEMAMKLTTKGYRLGYCEDAITYDEQPTGFLMSCRQRMRWNKGGLIIHYKYSWALLWSFIKKPTWTKYDLYFEMFPISFYQFIIGLIYNIASLIMFLTSSGTGVNYDFGAFIGYIIWSILGICFVCWSTSILVSIKERKLIHCSLGKLIWYNIIWPWFDLISIPLSLLSLFMKITWKPIPHFDEKTIQDLDAEEVLGKK
ncbi:MAG: glycosyltransferase family 2 protein [Bacilli bacterium]|nr:glycosyltransferase family 2 protein [Bacilli bacterium]